MQREANQLFLMGLLSVMDVLPNVSMSDVLAALQGDYSSRYRRIFEVVVDYEIGTWEQPAHSSRHIGPHENFLPDLYLRAARWVNDVLADAAMLA